jgi:hypothetical protein
MVEKIALASCNGMSPNGLVSRVAVGDCKKENENNKGITVKQTIEVGEILEPHNISSKDPFRLDDEGEKCVEIIKKEINKRME